MRLLRGCVALLLTVGTWDGAARAEDMSDGKTMGTTWHATWHWRDASHDGVPKGVVADEIASILERIDSRMSTWKTDSEVSGFNRSQSTDWYSVSFETAFVVGRASELSLQTDGAFDITVQPLVRLWGFGAEAAQQPPSTEEVARVAEAVGWELVEARSDPPAIRKRKPNTTIDLSAIAKGYAVDCVGRHLESLRVTGYLVEVGGETRVSGEKADGTPWRLGVEEPVPGKRTVRQVLHLAGIPRGVATSGDYRNRRVWGGKSHSHTIDPRSHRPVSHELASATVVAEDGLTADAWATALVVLGARDGRRLARSAGVEVLFLLRREGTIVEQTTPGFAVATGAAATGGMSWLGTWAVTLLVIVLAVTGLSAGVIGRGRGLVGSCGGLALLCSDRDDPQCAACGIRDTVDNDAIGSGGRKAFGDAFRD